MLGWDPLLFHVSDRDLFVSQVEQTKLVAFGVSVDQESCGSRIEDGVVGHPCVLIECVVGL